MSEIKFRAIIPVVDTYRKAREPISFIKLPLTLHDIIFGSNFPLFYNSKGETVFSRYVFNKWIDEGNSPDRFTGLKDKNGVDIWEGDIVFFNHHEHRYDGCGELVENYIKGKVGFYRACFLIYFIDEDDGKEWKCELYDSADISVIGNIYQNSELLDSGSK